MKTLVIKPIAFPSNGIHPFFAPLSAAPWSILLESGSADHIDSRFHIIVADPIATLVTEETQTTVNQASGRTVTTEDSFSVLQTLNQQLIGDIAPHTLDVDLPFIAGALGYFGYDLGRNIEKISSLANDDLNFPDMAVGLYDWAIVVDIKQQQAWQIQFSDHAEQGWQDRYDWLIQHGVNKQVQNKLTDNRKTLFELKNNWLSNMSEQEYHQKFDQIQQYLRSGDCYQINLAQRFNNQYQGDEWQAYCTLSQHNKAPFSAFMRLEDKAILSISPERFIQVKETRIETKPIKGTRPRSQDASIDHANALALQSAEKDRAENLMIVDLLRNDIGKVAVPGSVRVPKLFDVESFPAVHHLVSTIIGQMPADKHPSELLRACFPGGSITGAPKIRAMQIIEELEPHRRSLYCGSIGYLSAHGHMDTSITIRTLLCDSGEIYCWAGGGIVADSVGEEEYQETFDKLAKILPIL
ncbi:Para-aminobenzoate synthase component I [Moritella viscosa]|uniref:Para-aminobenzoate synthase component I n=1 Tax=Moritella viscosa TaxID=80854 RepID=A0A090ILT9_9GAMM|nr:aminodeoxychorismate synthase component I [Moritella viscosa]CED61379.1 para-aminobenzoate synthase component I [Moritella viscosa]SGY92280.1 Para-aminobenzoate synthase component I [Moritella viscosa]SGY95934.1 Para-aminobenzoate synthase component I [Moritella viscosa]SHO04127.1 Para-aminobenzoate synthase component I [Moritella viscosa]SHO04128.1 Para-aminobenzoate synthase component I [Moritella viscosa]